MIKKSKVNDKVSINFSTVWDSDYWMDSNGMFCGFNMPDALVSKKDGENEFANGLPPYNKRKFYLADEYPACPKNWVPSEGRKTSYFVPVKEGSGMWLDFNKNCSHKYEVAIVVSVQGINPITGMPCVDAGLEQYIDTCPKHDIKFGPHRFCEKCGYKWPKQNYLCTTGTPDGNLWLDGFRTASGVVRQYILTMDKIKGVANNIIKEDRVFAVGISFFLSNNPKPVVQQHNVLRGIYTGSAYCYGSVGGTLHSKSSGYKMGGGTKGGGSSASMPGTSKSGWHNLVSDYFDECASPGAAASETDNTVYTAGLCDTPDLSASDWRYDSRARCLGGGTVSASSIDSVGQAASKGSRKYGDPERTFNTIQTKSVNVKKVEIGAGANINQQVHDDPETLEFWRKEPEAVICINYCLENDCEKIIKGGKISLEGHKESFLKDIPKCNEKKEIVKV